MNWRLALRALFAPGNQTVVHVVGVTGDPVQAFKAEMMKVPLSRNGFDRMLAKLDATFVPPQTGALPDLGRGLYGPSLFYPANGTFGITRVCNHWIGELLGAAGFRPIRCSRPLPAGLLLDLRWRAGLRPGARARALTRSCARRTTHKLRRRMSAIYRIFPTAHAEGSAAMSDTARDGPIFSSDSLSALA